MESWWHRDVGVAVKSVGGQEDSLERKRLGGSLSWGDTGEV